MATTTWIITLLCLSLTSVSISHSQGDFSSSAKARTYRNGHQGESSYDIPFTKRFPQETDTLSADIRLENGTWADALLIDARLAYTLEKLVEQENEIKLIWGDDDIKVYDKVSKRCGQDMQVLEAARKMPYQYPWAFAYMNAGAKDEWPPKSLFLGNSWSEGSHDLCLGIKATGQDVYVNKTGGLILVGKHNFNAHYCKAQWNRPEYTIGASESWCLPQSCNKQDVVHLMRDNFPLLPNKTVYCGTKPPLKTNTGAIIAIVITSLFVLWVTLATIVDGIKTWREQEKNNDLQDSYKVHEVNGKYGDRYKDQAAMVHGIPSEPGALYRAFISFSLFKNLPVILATGGSRATYGCMNGLRFFAMAWIVCGHTGDIGSLLLPNPKQTLIVNMIGQFYLKGRFFHQILNSMNLAVDIFFFLGGTLASLSFMKTIKRLETKGWPSRLKEIGLYVFHRYWRLTPAVAAVLLIVPNLGVYFGSGPLFPEYIDQTDSCKKSWWVSLLYIQNLYRGPDNTDCLGHTWYLAVDFQFYLILPVFAVALYKSPFFGSFLLLLGWLGTTIARAVLISTPQSDFYWSVYIKPWCRFGPYAIGIFMGHILYKTKAKRVKINVHLVMLGWLASTLVAVLIIFGQYERGYNPAAGWYPWSIPEKRAYDILKRDAFSLCLAWTVFACINGYGGILNKFLSWDFFTVLSKLTYCGYLIHPIVHVVTLCSRHQLLYVQDITFIYQYLFVLTITLFISLGFSLVFEVPFMMLEKVILPKH